MKKFWRKGWIRFNSPIFTGSYVFGWNFYFFSWVFAYFHLELLRFISLSFAVMIFVWSICRDDEYYKKEFKKIKK